MFDELVEEAFAALWGFYPGWAVYLGKHEYDGAVPDWSAAADTERLDALADTADRLAALAGLDGEQEIDRELLLAAIAATRFDRTVLREAEISPMRWVYLLDPDLYLRRDFAPAQARARIVAGLLANAPELLGAARARLDERLDRTICRWGITAAVGLADMVDEEVVDGFGDDLDADTESRLAAAASSAAAELRGFAQWLETERLPFARDSFAIGREAMEQMLRLNELVDMSLDDLLALGERNLADNRAAFEEAAAELAPGSDPRRAYEEHVESIHAERGGLVRQTRDMLEDIRAFLVRRDLISIPSEVRAKVAATPRHMRWAFAMMDTPGPYETEATDAYYFVTPVEDEWDDATAEEWLRALNTYVLEDISIHEAYPGHYVHFLHYASAPTEVSRRLASYAFTEGWAHYTEQMMFEEGYRDGDARFRMAQLVEALVRNCRFVCAIRMHAHGMSVDEATQFFIDNAYYTETAARKEAERGTFDPGYFSYTLGKLQILALRDDYRRAVGDAFDLKAFHDRLLSRGAPPVRILRRLMLPAGAA
jgi:uncharacterized protein (DUF885 family)